MRPAAELREASRQMGRQTLRVAAALTEDAPARPVSRGGRGGPDPAHHPGRVRRPGRRSSAGPRKRRPSPICTPRPSCSWARPSACCPWASSKASACSSSVRPLITRLARAAASADRGRPLGLHARHRRREHAPCPARGEALPLVIPKPLKIGIGGPVGSGKTALVEALSRRLKDRYDLAVITNDIYTKEDAEFLVRRGVLPPERILGVETGGCPHTAIREDASVNLEAIRSPPRPLSRSRAALPGERRRQPGRDLQPRAGGRDDLRDRRGRGREDPAQGRGRDHALRPSRHQQDRPGALRGRRPRGHGDATRGACAGERPFVFTNVRAGDGVDTVSEWIRRELLFES